MKKLGLLIILLTIGSALFATPLWNGTTLGMTTDEVSDLFPDVIFEESEEDVPGIGLLNAATLSNFSIGRKLYDVYFFFINGQLTIVQLTLQNDGYIPENVITDIRLQLIAKYGPYIDRTIDEFKTNMSFKTYNWIKEGVRIELSWSIVFGEHSVRIEYSAIEDYSLF